MDYRCLDEDRYNEAIAEGKINNPAYARWLHDCYKEQWVERYRKNYPIISKNNEWKTLPGGWTVATVTFRIPDAGFSPNPWEPNAKIDTRTYEERTQRTMTAYKSPEGYIVGETAYPGTYKWK